MSASPRIFLMMLLGFMVIGSGGMAWADDQAKAPSTAVAAEQAKAPSSADTKGKVRNTPDSFERTARLESMRYRHLWLAYGFIWLIVFVFMFRTWKLHQSNRVELDALTRRLKALESEEKPPVATVPSGGQHGDT